VLESKIESAEKTIKKYLEVQNNISRAHELELIKINVLKLKERSMEYIKLRKSLNGIINISPDPIKELLDDMEKIQRFFDENYGNLIKEIQNLMTKVEYRTHDLKKEWHRYFMSSFSNILGTLSLLERIVEAERISKIHNDIMHIGNKKWPISKEDVDNLGFLKVEAENIIKKLEINSEVQQFLRKILSDEATVEDLTPGIISWLREKGSAKNIILSFRKDI